MTEETAPAPAAVKQKNRTLALPPTRDHASQQTQPAPARRRGRLLLDSGQAKPHSEGCSPTERGSPWPLQRRQPGRSVGRAALARMTGRPARVTTGEPQDAKDASACRYPPARWLAQLGSSPRAVTAPLPRGPGGGRPARYWLVPVLATSSWRAPSVAPTRALAHRGQADQAARARTRARHSCSQSGQRHHRPRRVLIPRLSGSGSSLRVGCNCATSLASGWITASERSAGAGRSSRRRAARGARRRSPHRDLRHGAARGGHLPQHLLDCPPRARSAPARLARCARRWPPASQRIASPSVSCQMSSPITWDRMALRIMVRGIGVRSTEHDAKIRRKSPRASEGRRYLSTGRRSRARLRSSALGRV
jgi:hypothetical protein